MYVTVGEEEYKLVFDHRNYSLSPKDAEEIGLNGTTECRIIHVATGREVGEGAAYCVLGDQYDKEKGRKYALSRALGIDEYCDGAKFLTKDQRREIWNQYLNRKKGPSKIKTIFELLNELDDADRLTVKTLLTSKGN